MQNHQATRNLQFWIAAIAITAINLSVWLVPRPGGTGPSPTTTGPEPLRIRWASGGAFVERSGRLELTFDRTVFTDDQVGRPLQRSPFTIEPALPGVWEVSRPDAVAFVPAEEIPPGNLLRVGTDSMHPFFRPWAFDAGSLPVIRYRPLVVEDVSLGDVTMPADPAATRTATVRVAFNQPVRRSNLLTHLTLEVDGVAAEPATLDDTIATQHDLTVEVKPGSQVTVAVDEDLHGQEGLLGLGRDVRRAFRVSPSLEVRWTSPHIDWYDRSGHGRTITVGFDRQLAASATPAVRVEPDPGGVRTRVLGNRLIIDGGFEAGRSYRVTIDPPLMALDRSLLDQQIVRAVRMPTPSPHLSFEETEGQIVPGGRFEVALRHGGYAKARLLVHRLVDEHLPMMLGEFIGNRRLPRASDVVCDRMIDLPQHAGGRGVTMLQLDDFVERRPGVYHVEIEDPDESWRSDTVVLVVSDLAIDLEVGERTMAAWVTSVSTGEPLPDVEVTAWAPNITALESPVTGPDGVARLPLGGDEIRIVTARRGDDVIFVRPRRAAAIEDRTLAGPAWTGPVDAAFYAERGVHRPGETLHLTAVVRTRDGEPVTDTPYEIRWIRPDERVARTHEATTDPVQGVLHADLETDAMDPTGTWIAALHLPGSDTPVTTLECPVMPFLPVRLRVEATAESSEDGRAAMIRSTTTYLHGSPAEGLAGTITARWTPARFSDPRFAEFTFEPRRSVEIERESRDLRTDDLGEATVTIASPSSPAVWNLLATVSVQEVGGRSTSRTVETTLDTQAAHVGLRLPAGRIHAPGEDILGETVVLADGVVDLDRTPDLRLARIERDWNYERVDGRWRWRSTESVIPMTTTVAVELDTATDTVTDDATDDGPLPFRLPGLGDGEYRLTATVPGTDITANVDFHVSRWRSEGRMAAERSDRLELVPDRDIARPGETMSVLVRSPFPGTALVSVETDDIARSTVVEIDGTGVNVPVEIPEDARDTAFVSAILVRPLDSDRTAWAPLVARGAARIGIDRTPHRLAPAISASTDARPGDVVHASVVVPDASASAVVHLWAVEEGALLPTDYHAPDPVDMLFRDRRRMVNAISSIVDLIPEFDRTSAGDAIGGDVAARRREPVPVRLPETRVIWRHAETLGDDGRIEADLTMPQLDGAMRLMAVAIDGDRYGATEHLIGVVPAIQIVAALPRTMAPGDRASIPVTLRNNTAAATEVGLGVDPTDRLDVDLDAATVRLEPGEATTVDLVLRPTRVGEAPITLRATAGERSEAQAAAPVETVKNWQIAVRPPFGFQRETQRLIVDGGTTRRIDRDRRLEAAGGTVDVIVSAVPDVDLGPAVQDLIDYPYGCGEQIGSRIEGLLAALTVDPSVAMADAETIRSMAASGLARLWETQGRDGRIPYWTGGRGDDWLTARTAMLANRALDRDVPMPSGFREGLLDAVSRIVARDRIDRGTRILGLRALGQAGRADEAAVETMLLELDDLSLVQRAHLASVLADQERVADARALVDGFVEPTVMRPTDRDIFTSDATEAAIALGVGLRVHPESSSLVGLRDFVAARQGDRRWRTTYETAASIEALTAWSRVHPATGDARGTVIVAGHEIRFDGGEPVHARIEIDPDAVGSDVERIVSEGDGPLHVVVTTSGVPTTDDAGEPTTQGLEVTRRWLDADGEPIDRATAITAGRTVVVDVTYRSTLGADLPNVAIVDVLPSGFELELPALMTSASSETRLDDVDHVEFRDDRVMVFDTATTSPQRFRYVIRAVVPGDWARPGTVAESMYQDAVRSTLPIDRVAIELDSRP